MLRVVAQMQEWYKDKFIAEAQQDCRFGAEKVAEFDKHIYLAMKRLTAGIAREIVGTSKTAGEACTDSLTVLREERARRNRHCQSTPRIEATHPDCSTIFEKNQMPRAIVRAAHMRVVPETHRRAMETQVDVDKVEPHNL